MKYLCLLFYLISLNECTVDLSIQDLVYIADHLTAAECRRLFASLLFTSRNLPANLSDAEQKVPKDVPCVKLLIKWNSGEQPWEGKGKSHTIVEHRLRQLGKNDLADWLGKLVFHQLIKYVNNSLQYERYFEEDKPGLKHKVFRDKDCRAEGERWSTLDTIFSVTLFGLLFIALAALCRMLRLIFRRARVKRSNCKDPEEMVDLMSAESIDSDQETIYELDMENGKRSHVSFKLDLEKPEDESDK